MDFRGGMAQRVVVDRDLGFRAILDEIEALSNSTLLVGIQEEAKTHVQNLNGRTQIAGESVAEYAAKNEFGSGNIPQRSFMRTAFDENLTRIEAITAIQYGKILDQDIGVRQGIGIIGQAITGMIKIKIRQIVSPPNSAYTIAKKGSSKPLIDFGQMFGSITYVVKTRS